MPHSRAARSLLPFLLNGLALYGVRGLFEQAPRQQVGEMDPKNWTVR